MRVLSPFETFAWLKDQPGVTVKTLQRQSCDYNMIQFSAECRADLSTLLTNWLGFSALSNGLKMSISSQITIFNSAEITGACACHQEMIHLAKRISLEPLSPVVLCGHAEISDCQKIKFGLCANHRTTLQELN